MRILFLSVALVLITGCDVQNYDDCILKHMKDVKDQTAAILIRQSCLEKYPNTSAAQKNSTQKKCLSRELNSSEIQKVQVVHKGGNRHLMFSVYNGNEQLILNGLRIEVFSPNYPAPQVYQHTLGLLSNGIHPLTSEDELVSVAEYPTGKWSWRVLAIQGHCVQ